MKKTERCEQNEIKSSNDEVEKMPEGRAGKILQEMKTKLKDDDTLAQCWRDLVLESKIMFCGQQRGLYEIAKHIRAKVKLPADMSMANVRAKELELGDLLQIVITEAALARHGKAMFNERKKDYLASAKDKRKSVAVIEAELAKMNEEFQYVRGISMSADLNYQFWQAMLDIINSTFDRLKQVSISLAAEAKVDNFVNPGVSNKKGDRV